MDKVSIIIPVYNEEKNISRCIESVIKQSYSNIEVIIINDGSTDNSLNICNKYKKNDDRIIIVNKINEGVSRARNIGIERATGKFITFVDSDDYMDVDCIKILVEDIINLGVDMSIVGFKITDDNNGVIYKSKDTTRNIISNSEYKKELLIERYFIGSVWGKMFKKDMIKNIKFNVDMKIAEDLEFLLKVSEVADYISINNRKLYNYYRNQESVTKTSNFSKFNDEIMLLKRYLEKEKGGIYKRFLIRYLRINIDLVFRYGEEAIECYKEIKRISLKCLFDLKLDIKHKIKFLIIKCFSPKVYYRIKAMYK